MTAPSHPMEERRQPPAVTRDAAGGGDLPRAEAVFAEARQRAERLGEAVLAVVSQVADGLDPITLFATFGDDGTPCLLWESGDPYESIFGLGVACELAADGPSRFHRVARQWHDLAAFAVVDGPVRPRIAGGFRFDADVPRAAHWAGFGAASMVLPEVLVVRSAAGCGVAIQRLVAAHDSPTRLAQRARALLDRVRSATPSAEPDTRPRWHDPRQADAAAWQALVGHGVDAIRTRQFEKVVLARDVCQALDAPAAPACVPKRLRANDARAHVFAFRRGPACFLGASPERLVRVQQQKIQTQALAGSIGRHPDPDADRALGHTLMNSAKDRHEHAVVVAAITGALAPLVSRIRMPDVPRLQYQPAIQHLSTPIEAMLSRDAGVLDAVAALHPTPAVAGQPRPDAMAYIAQHEGFDRGWYAAPVGWMDADGNGDFLVALRSALVTANTCHLFAGAGIVAASDPAAEWHETTLKLATMRRAIFAG